jgi:hypothetical protein
MATLITTTSSIIPAANAGAPFYFPAKNEVFRLSDGALVIIYVRDSQKITYSISLNNGVSWTTTNIYASSYTECSILQVGDNFILYRLPASTGNFVTMNLTYNSALHTISAGTRKSQESGYSGGVRIVPGCKFDGYNWAFPIKPATTMMMAYFGVDPADAWTSKYSIAASSSIRSVSAAVMSDRIKMFSVIAGKLYTAEITGSAGTYTYGAYSLIKDPVTNNGYSLDTCYLSDSEIYVSFRVTGAGLYIMQYNGTSFEAAVLITDKIGRGNFCLINGIPIYIYVNNDGAGNTGIAYTVYKGMNTWGPPVDIIAPQSDYTIYYVKTNKVEPTSTISIFYTVSTGSYNILFESVTILLGGSISHNEGIKISESVEMEPKYPWWPDKGITVNPSCCYAMEATTNISGLDHLEGQVVAILANGEYLGEHIVISGQVDLSEYYSKIVAGLPYESDFETLKMNIQNNVSNTVQGVRMKVGNVTFHLRDTKGGSIGPDEENLYEAFTVDSINKYSGDNINENDLYTGKLRMPLGGQYGYGGHIFIKQVKPYPITIGSVIPEVDIGGYSR